MWRMWSSTTGISDAISRSRSSDFKQHAVVAPRLHDPAELAHRRPEHLEHVEADPAHHRGLAAGREQMEAQPPHAEPVPFAQRRGRNARVGDGDAAEAIRKALERVEHHAVVETVGVPLHDHAARDAEVVVQRDEWPRPAPPAACSRGRARTESDPPARRYVRACPTRPAPAFRRDGADARPGRRSAAVRWFHSRRRAHPSLMLASLTTRSHFSISAFTKARNSSGVFSRNSTLSCLRRATTSAWRSTG